MDIHFCQGNNVRGSEFVLQCRRTTGSSSGKLIFRVGIATIATDCSPMVSIFERAPSTVVLEYYRSEYNSTLLLVGPSRPMADRVSNYQVHVQRTVLPPGDRVSSVELQHGIHWIPRSRLSCTATTVDALIVNPDYICNVRVSRPNGST
jgi:hypothetical protein